MNPRQALIRKVIYVGLMVPLVVLLAWLGMPAAPGVKGAQGSPGGVLAQMREKEGLSPTSLGDIDPTSETLKLATLGLRGVAATILWEKANDYKMKKDWTNLAATLNQIIKVQPNFVAVWRFQGWNLSYNVSAEFDDYRERYRWVIRGIEFLEEGVRHNRQDAILVWDIGWFISQKIGRSDERREFRVLFKQDDDFHGPRPTEFRDNWLVGKEWYEKCLELVDSGARMRGTPVLYRSDPAKAQMNYADAIETDGTFGEVARMEWKRAKDEWHEFGSIDLPTSFGRVVRLNDLEPLQATIATWVAALDAIEPGLRAKLVAEKRAALTPKQREALDTPVARRTPEQIDEAQQAEAAVFVGHDEVARRIKGSPRKQALKLAEQIKEVAEEASIIESQRGIINFAYWRTRAEYEHEKQTTDAREAIFRGNEALARSDLQSAWQHYEDGLKLWRKVLDRHPALVRDLDTHSVTIDDLMEIVEGYQRILKQLDEPFPQQFILQDVIDAKKAKDGGEE